MSSEIIKVSNISKTYRGYDIDHKESGVVLWAKNAFKLTSNRASTVRALENISFTVERGQVFGIYGANGAGKTTLIKILSGLLLPDRGSVEVNGFNGANAIKEQISYVSTNGWMGLEWQLTAHENVMLYGNIFGLHRVNLHARCDAVLARFGMLEARDKHISELSAGMRQKVTLARGFLLNRPILYLDEPSVSLDVPSARAFRMMLAQYGHLADECSEPKTVLISSHNPLDLQICDHILMLHQGRVVAEGTMDELKAPLQGIVALHIRYSIGHQTDLGEQAILELGKLMGVRSVLSGRIHSEGQTRSIRLLIQHGLCSTGEIIDWFIRNDLPVVAMRQDEVTLQEVYDSHLEVPYAC